MVGELQGLNTYLALLQTGGASQFPGLIQQQQQGPAMGIAQAAGPVDIQGAFAAGESAARGNPQPGMVQQPAQAGMGPQRAFARGGAVRGYQWGGPVTPEDDYGGLPRGGYGGRDDDELDGMDPMFMQLMQGEMGGGEGELTKQDKMLALAKAGFATAAGQSPHALSNIGAGGVAGLDALQDMKRQRALLRMREAQQMQNTLLRQQGLEIQKARLQQQRDAAKTRADANVSPLARLQTERDALAAEAGPDDPRVKQYDALIEKTTKGAEGGAAVFEKQIDALVKENPGMTRQEATNIILTPQDTRANRAQQAGLARLPGGDEVPIYFDPAKRGNFYKDKDGTEKPLPFGADIITPGNTADLTPKQFTELEQSFLDKTIGIKRLDSYFGDIIKTKQGIGVWVDGVAARAKTAADSGELTDSQFAQMTSEQKREALVGLMRLDIAGPGAMSNFDAERIDKALGGKVSALRNKKVVQTVLQEFMDSKMLSAELTRRQILRNKEKFKVEEKDYVLPAPRFLTREPAPGGRTITRDPATGALKWSDG